jgi:hypothetical protein
MVGTPLGGDLGGIPDVAVIVGVDPIAVVGELAVVGLNLARELVVDLGHVFRLAAIAVAHDVERFAIVDPAVECVGVEGIERCWREGEATGVDLAEHTAPHQHRAALTDDLGDST